MPLGPTGPLVNSVRSRRIENGDRLRSLLEKGGKYFPTFLLPKVERLSMTEELELVIDIERRTTRGRSCPRCGGKIIPSIRAVYQSSGDPNAVFAAWQCERCSYEEVVTRVGAKPAGESPGKAPPKEARETAALKAPSRPATQVQPPEPAPLRDAQGRALPPDVRALVSQIKKAQSKDPAST